MLKKQVTVIAPNGMSQRYATAIVHEANNFKCDIKLNYGNDVVDAKSIMNVLALSVEIRQDTNFEINTEGEDEAEALGTLIGMLKKMQFIKGI
jgi:phosphotransferase system HPr (HPr) family protein